MFFTLREFDLLGNLIPLEIIRNSDHGSACFLQRFIELLQNVLTHGVVVERLLGFVVQGESMDFTLHFTFRGEVTIVFCSNTGEFDNTVSAKLVCELTQIWSERKFLLARLGFINDRVCIVIQSSVTLKIKGFIQFQTCQRRCERCDGDVLFEGLLKFVLSFRDH